MTEFSDDELSKFETIDRMALAMLNSERQKHGLPEIHSWNFADDQGAKYYRDLAEAAFNVL